MNVGVDQGANGDVLNKSLKRPYLYSSFNY